MKITTSRILTRFPTTSQIFSNHKIMVSVNNGGQFTRKSVTPQEKLLDLVNLVLTTTGTLVILSFTSKLMVLQWEGQHLQPQQKVKYRLMNKPQYLRKFGNILLMRFIPFLNVCTWKTFSHHINNLHQNIRFTREEESKGELAFLDTLLKMKRIMDKSLYWYIGSLSILTNTYTTALIIKQVARKVLFPPCLIEHVGLFFYYISVVRKNR